MDQDIANCSNVQLMYVVRVFCLVLYSLYTIQKIVIVLGIERNLFDSNTTTFGFFKIEKPILWRGMHSRRRSTLWEQNSWLSSNVKWDSFKLLRHLCHCQSFSFWYVVYGKVQKVCSGGHKAKKCKRLRILEQNGKGKGDKPICNPINENTDSHGCISSVQWKDLRNTISGERGRPLSER